MEVSLFLAKVFGLYLLILGVAMVLHPRLIRQLFNDLLNSPAALWLSAIITLILGLLCIAGHNRWVENWTVVITILSWLVFIKGALRVLFPQVDSKWGGVVESNGMFYASAAFNILLGIFLTAKGLQWL